MRAKVILTASLLVLVAASASPGQTISSTSSAGYSRFFPQRPERAPLPRDGFYFDEQVLTHPSWAVLPDGHTPVLLGGALSGSGYINGHDLQVQFAPGRYTTESLDSNVDLFSIEARAAIPIRFEAISGLSIVPTLGAGLLINEYSVNALVDESGDMVTGPDHVGAAFLIRPGLEIGYAWSNFAAGIDISYMAAWGDFGRIGAGAQELRGGVFFRFRF